MNVRSRLHVHQRGVAVITALLLTTLAITIVASLFWQQQVQVRAIENQRLQLQKQWVLRGALDWAKLILNEQGKHAGTDDLTQQWAVPLEETQLDQYVENGKTDSEASDAALSGNIVDAQSRYNLQNLADGGIVNLEELKIFQRLLTNAHVKPSLAQTTADMIAATQPKAANPPGAAVTQSNSANPAGATASNSSPTSSSRPMAFEQVDDLLAVPGFTVEMLDKVKDLVVVLPESGTAINLNTAGADVLAAEIDTLSQGDAAALLASRERYIFKNIMDFQTRLPGKTISSGAAKIDVRTKYFLVNGKVRLNRASLETQALVFRPITMGDPKIIWVREN